MTKPQAVCEGCGGNLSTPSEIKNRHCAKARCWGLMNDPFLLEDESPDEEVDCDDDD